MTTYSPVGPFTLGTDEDTSTIIPEPEAETLEAEAETLEAEAETLDAAAETLDALPLLDARLLTKTIPTRLALRGYYLTLGDPVEARLLALDQDIIHLGRGLEADIRFDDHRVSRDHAILVRHGSRLRLLDNRSPNGTFVNGRRIVATNLSSGDVIELGPVRMQLIEVR